MRIPQRDEILKRRLTTPMEALQAASDLIEAYYLTDAVKIGGEGEEMTVCVMTDLRTLAQAQPEAIG